MSDKVPRRRSASMGVATALSRKQMLLTERKNLPKPTFAEEHYDMAEIEKRKKEVMEFEVEKARKDTEAALRHAEEMKASSERAAEELACKEAEMESLQKEVSTKSRQAQEKIRHYEMRHTYLAEELTSRKENEKQIHRELSMLKHKHDDARENAAWEREAAVQAMQAAIKKEVDVAKELEQLPMKIQSEMKRKLEQEIERGELRKFDQEAMVEAIVARMSEGYNMESAMAEIIDSLKAQLAAAQRPPVIPLVETVSSTSSSTPPSEPSPDPPTPGSSYLDDNDADYLLMQVEHPSCRMLRSMSPCFKRLHQALQSAVAACLSTLALGVVPLPDVAFGIPESICLNLRLGETDEVTTTCVRLVSADNGTATYEADIEIAKSPQSTKRLRSQSRGRVSKSSVTPLTPRRASPAATRGNLTHEERVANHLQRKLEYKLEAKKKAQVKADQEVKAREQVEKERHRKEAQSIIRKRLTPKKVRPKPEPELPTSPIEDLITSAIVHTSVEELLPHMQLRERIERVVDDLRQADSTQCSELSTPVVRPYTRPAYQDPGPYVQLEPEPRHPPSLHSHSTLLKTEHVPPPVTDGVADRLRQYSLAVAKGTGINIVKKELRRPSQGPSTPREHKRATVIRLHTGEVAQPRSQVISLHGDTAHSTHSRSQQSPRSVPPAMPEVEDYLPEQASPLTVPSPVYPTPMSSPHPAMAASPQSRSSYGLGHTIPMHAVKHVPDVSESPSVSPRSQGKRVSLSSASSPRAGSMRGVGHRNSLPGSPASSRSRGRLQKARQSLSPSGSPISLLPSLPSAVVMGDSVQEQIVQQQKREAELQQMLQDQDLNSSFSSKQDFAPHDLASQVTVLTRPDDAPSPMYSTSKQSVVALDGLFPPQVMDRVSFMDDISLPHRQVSFEGWASPFDSTPPSSARASKVGSFRKTSLPAGSPQEPEKYAMTMPQTDLEPQAHPPRGMGRYGSLGAESLVRKLNEYSLPHDTLADSQHSLPRMRHGSLPEPTAGSPRAPLHPRLPESRLAQQLQHPHEHPQEQQAQREFVQQQPQQHHQQEAQEQQGQRQHQHNSQNQQPQRQAEQLHQHDMHQQSQLSQQLHQQERHIQSRQLHQQQEQEGEHQQQQHAIQEMRQQQQDMRQRQQDMQHQQQDHQRHQQEEQRHQQDMCRQQQDVQQQQQEMQQQHRQDMHQHQQQDQLHQRHQQEEQQHHHQQDMHQQQQDVQHQQQQGHQHQQIQQHDTRQQDEPLQGQQQQPEPKGSQSPVHLPSGVRVEHSASVLAVTADVVKSNDDSDTELELHVLSHLRSTVDTELHKAWGGAMAVKDDATQEQAEPRREDSEKEDQDASMKRKRAATLCPMPEVIVERMSEDMPTIILDRTPDVTNLELSARVPPTFNLGEEPKMLSRASPLDGILGSEPEEEDLILQAMFEDNTEMYEHFQRLPLAEQLKVKHQLRSDLAKRQDEDSFGGTLVIDKKSPISEAVEELRKRNRARSMHSQKPPPMF